MAESAKDKAEQNAQNIEGGQVYVEKDGKDQWVSADTLSPGQLAETQNQSNAGPASVPNSPAAAPPPNPWEQLADAQANQYLSMTKALDPLTSGATLPAADETMSANASQMLGQSATSPISQWLNQQTQAAQAQGAPVTAAEAQLGQAEDANSKMVAGGLTEMGQAEASQMQAAPYQQLLQSLASEVPYHLASGYSIPGMTTANTPSWLQGIESNAGVTTLQASKGSSDAAKGLLPAPSAGVLASSTLTQPSSSPAPQS